MWNLTYPWWEIVLRAVIIYIGIFFLFRLIGKKPLGKMSPFDFVLLLIISRSVGSGLIGRESSVGGAFLSAITLLLISYLVDLTVFKSPRLEKIIEGQPQFIIVNGLIQEEILKKEKITHEELKAALREENVEHPQDVKYAILENNGHINIIKKKD
jgi:uncharacterized membrane protein YcaP (DUF421 family)